jgi:GTPase
MAQIVDRPSSAGTKAFLVGVHVGNVTVAEGRSLLEELGELVWTLGLPIVGSMLVKVPGLHAAYFVGTGKAAEIVALAKAADAGVIIFDNELTPGQQRNWEKLSGLAVIDREEVILDIFAGRARSREARLQVALARAQYSLPRLTRAWGHLDRQGGGVGGRGEGESQLEIDRRLVRRSIEKLKEELAGVRSQRATQRKRRQRIPLPRASIVGYTNAGKSSLLKKLTGADVFVEDKLFATLDPTTRRVDLPSGQTLLLTDTVGFVRRLPTRLVEAFKATLEEAVLAEFLIHVLDASDPEVYTFHATTMAVLHELGADEKPILTVLNKVDRLAGNEVLLPLKRHFADALLISAKTGEGLDELLHRCAEVLSDRPAVLELLLPHDRGELLSQLHRQGRVVASEAEDGGMRVHAVVPPRILAKFIEFQVQPTPAPKRTPRRRPRATAASRAR